MSHSTPPPPPVPNAPYQHTANSVYLTSTLNKLVYVSPATSTFIVSLQAGYLTTWPGLTATMVNTYLCKSMTTAKGHMYQQSDPPNLRRKILNTTLTTPRHQHKILVWLHLAFAIIINATQATGKMYTNITGRFPGQSSCRNKCIFVFSNNDSNMILVEPMKSIAAPKILRAFYTLRTRL